MIPNLIKSRLLEYCQKSGGLRVDIHHEDNPQAFYGLSFKYDGSANLLSGDVKLITYIENHLKYAKRPIMIKVDGKDLKDIVSVLPLELPPSIDLTNTEITDHE